MHTKSILMFKYLLKYLNLDEKLKVYKVGFFPIVATNLEEYPFITFTKDNITTNSETKDIITEDLISFSFNVVSDEYSKTTYIAQHLREIIEVRELNLEDVTLTDIELTNYTETYSEGAYINTLSFNAILTNA